MKEPYKYHKKLDGRVQVVAQYPLCTNKDVGNRRLDLGLLQREVADRIGAMKDSVYLWEANRVTPAFPFLPKIVGFLGYCPYDPDWTPGERLTWIRRYLGLSQEAMARRLRVDPGTLGRWEKGEREPKAEHLHRMSRAIWSGPC